MTGEHAAMPTGTPMIRVVDLRKTFRTGKRDEVAVRGVSVDVHAGEFYTLLGPSGSGKTTVLRCIAGLEEVDAGRIEIAGMVVATNRVKAPPYARGIGMVFQSYAVWPHMTVFENVAFPLRMQRRGRGHGREMRATVMEALERVNLAHVHDRPAPALSGGQQQRVALARALVGRPKVLLLDEPLSNLDSQLRAQMRVELRRLTRELGITSLYVTHDQVEALTMSDRVGVMHDGELIQEGTSVDLYRRPRTAFVARFLGTANLTRGRVVEAADSPDGIFVVESRIGRVRCMAAEPFEVGADVDIVLRPENLRLGRDQDDEDFNWVTAKVLDTMFVGSYTHCELDVDGTRLTSHIQSHDLLAAGQEARFRFRPQWCTAVPASGTGSSEPAAPVPAVAEAALGVA